MHKSWGILILSFPTSNFQCLCSAEFLVSVRAEQMSVLMDLLNHKKPLAKLHPIKSILLFTHKYLERSRNSEGSFVTKKLHLQDSVFWLGKVESLGRLAAAMHHQLSPGDEAEPGFPRSIINSWRQHRTIFATSYNLHYCTRWCNRRCQQKYANAWRTGFVA